MCRAYEMGILLLLALVAPQVVKPCAGQAMKKQDQHPDRAGPYVMLPDLDAASRSKAETEITTFIWNHWKAHRPGTLTVTQYAKEGEPTKAFYVISPDEKGVWQMAVTLERTVAKRPGSAERFPETIRYRAYSIEQVTVSGKGDLASAAAADRGAGATAFPRLLLKDKAGKVLSTL